MNKKIIKILIFLFGLAFALGSLIMYLRIFIIISLGYQYVAYESNTPRLFFEIFICLIAIFIVLGLSIDLLLQLRKIE